jgi:Flp pilus assembly protein TadG
MRNFSFRAASFLADRRGNFMITFAAAVFAVGGVAGLAIDYSRVENARVRARDAADAAAMGAVLEYSQTGKKPGAEKYGDDMFDSNLDLSSGINLISRKVKINPGTGRAVVTARVEVPTTLMALLGHKTMVAEVTSEAEIGSGSGKPYEIGLMLDLSSSMAGDRIAGLKAAVAEMASDILGTGGSRNRIALAPFASSVNAGTFASALVGKTSVMNCVGERLGKDRFTDNAPSGDFFDFADEPVHFLDGGVYQQIVPWPGCPVAPIQPLTNDPARIQAALNTFAPDGTTAGHVGMYFAWYLVAEKWRNFWPADARPSKDSESQKVVVLMSDGEFNTYFDTANGEPNEQGRQICAQMKRENYLIYAVVFDTDEGSYDMLRECVSEPGFFFGPDTVSGLKDAFKSITDSLQSSSGKPRLVN